MAIQDSSIKLLFSIIVALILGRLIIPLLKRASIGQNVSEYGPESHLDKQGTPTMGGIIIVLSLLLCLLIFTNFSKELFLVLFASLAFGLVGLIDDSQMLIFNKAEGLTPKQKMLMQIGISLLLTLMFRFIMPQAFGLYKLPFLGREARLNLLSYLIYPFVMVGTVNAVNLTDGLDGLLSSVSLPVFIYLIIQTRSMGPVGDFALIFLGSLIGFIAYNSNIASVFMGDTGSMTIGGAVAILSIITGHTFYLPIFGFIYVIEAGSVIIQVISVKKRDGKKVFPMTPIHHSFELKGYSEQKIVTLFAIASLIACLVASIV